MSNLYIEVEILAGTGIKDACKELCTLANKLNIGAATKFNGKDLFALPTSDPLVLAADYEKFAFIHDD